MRAATSRSTGRLVMADSVNPMEEAVAKLANVSSLLSDYANVTVRLGKKDADWVALALDLAEEGLDQERESGWK